MGEPGHPPPPAAQKTAPRSGAAARSGPARALERLGLVRDVDLLLHLPLRYEDETRVTPLATLREGQPAQVEGVVVDSRVDTRSRRQLRVRLRDASGELLLRFLNFHAALQKTTAAGQRLRVRGELRRGFEGPEMVHPQVRAITEGAPLPTSLTPVYPATAALPQAYLRKVIATALGRTPLAELLPSESVPPGLPSLRAAVHRLHQPPADADIGALQDRSDPAWLRLKWEELLAQQLAQAEARRERAALRAPVLAAASPASLAPGSGAPQPWMAQTAAPDWPPEQPPSPGLASAGLHTRLLTAIPFKLTGAQQRVGEEIDADLAQPQPMHRLLQGDVGSGKTVVAALAAARAIDAGWQCALMAPTEILAEQHFRKLVGWLAPLGVGVAWLSGSRKGRERREMLARVASGEAALVVGTHAVIQDDVSFARLALAIVDEQHRFGVAQRLALRQKLAEAQLEPHLLMMSATPIPRTLAMTYFADLDVSTLDELPPGRTPVLTKVLADNRRDAVLARIREAVAQGRQVYWVCPLIEESAALDLQNATETHAQLAAVLPDARVGLLHGRLPPAEKAATMAQFSAGALSVLVSTTVIEVGVDVPNASLMVVEHAERFGLAQLHQLRGRVGRGSAASVCVLLYAPPLSDTGKARLRAMAETNDGFEIARRDLEIRGPGEFLGARQSGDALLRFADLQNDAALLAHARQWAPRLWAEHPASARAQVERWLGGREVFLKA
jgi:ATP-dependent DNA helicase RecG